MRAYLQGEWRLARLIDDRRLGQTGTLRGRASFAPEGDGLRYGERGHLSLGAYGARAERTYLYRFPGPSRAEVRFADGRPFHDLDLTGGHWEAEHSCGDDIYRGAFTVIGRDVFEVTWRVTGPRKDAVSISRHRRRPGGGEGAPGGKLIAGLVPLPY